MIHIDFDPARLEGEQKAWWARWQRRAARATRKTIEAWEESKGQAKIRFNENIWGDLKDWLLANFYSGKCAYCETRNPRFPLDAEHYRPKAGVENQPPGDGAPAPARTEDETGAETNHPGYFWLAYHWKNLVPSCKHCNSGQGKQNQFPAGRRHVLVKRLEAAQAAALRERPQASAKWADFYYLQPDDLDALEEPLLLHPYRDRPEEHLAFEHGGVIAWTSPLGEHTVCVCNLREEELRVERQRAQEAAANQFGIAYLAELPDAPGDPRTAYQRAWGRLKDVETGQAEYSAAVRSHVRRVFPEPG